MSGSVEKSKGLSLTWKIIITTAALALIFLGLSIGAAFASPVRANNAIDKIGAVSYTADSKKKIDLAIEYYDAVGKNGLKEYKHFGAAYLKANLSVKSAEKLDAAKKEYVRLAIRAIEVAEQRRVVDNYTDEDIIALVKKARAAADEYFKNDYGKIETYSSLIGFEQEYDVSADQSQSGGGSSSEEDTEIELC